MNNFEIFDNVLPKQDFLKIKNLMYESQFPWFFSKNITYEGENNNDMFYMTHTFLNNSKKLQHSNFLQNISPIIDKIDEKCDIKCIIRIKGNLYPNQGKMIIHNNHKDYEYKHKGALFYINTNNGFTILNNKTKIDSVENRLLLFDPHIEHCSTSCTDAQARININFNFF